jgi:hypothetical protein
VLLYYPIRDVWSEYKPVAGKLTVESQSQRLRDIVNSFMDLGQRLTRAQISFAMADHENLAASRIQGDTIHLGSGSFKALVLPAGVELPPAADQRVKQFETAGGRVLRATDIAAAAKTYDSGLVSPASERVIVGRFTRAGREIILAVNVGRASYDGAMTARGAVEWIVGDPAVGMIQPVQVNPQGQIVLSLPPRATRVFVAKN